MLLVVDINAPKILLSSVVFNHYIWFIPIYFSIILDCKFKRIVDSFASEIGASFCLNHFSYFSIP